MEKAEKKKRRIAAKVTTHDRDIVEQIRKIGFVNVGPSGDVSLEVGSITDYRANRLIALGILEPSNDALFEGMTQTLKFKENAEEINPPQGAQ